MKRIVYLFCMFAFGSAAILAGSASYVVVQDSDKDSLVRVATDGSSVTTIANGAAGVGLTLDHQGNYIIVAKLGLLRVTRGGDVATIATAPGDSKWVAVVADSHGDLIIADAFKHALWRVSADGASVTMFAQYGEVFAGEIGLVVDATGDFLVLIQGFDRTPEAHILGPALYRITPAGAVSRVFLTGAVARLEVRPGVHRASFPSGPTAPNALTGGALIPDGSGNYLFLDGMAARKSLFRLSNSGVVTKLTHFDANFQCGLARNPETGEFVTASVCNLMRSSADGLSTGLLTQHHDKLCGATAVIVDQGN